MTSRDTREKAAASALRAEVRAGRITHREAQRRLLKLDRALPAPMPDAPDWRTWLLGSHEVCARYGVSRATLANWRRDPAFPRPAIVNQGRTMIWHRVELDAWHADRRG